MSTLVHITYLPTCGNCKRLIHDLLLYYRSSDDVYFYFSPSSAYPRYEKVRERMLENRPFLAVNQSPSLITPRVPLVVANGKVVVADTGVYSHSGLFRFHPVTLMPFIRAIGKRKLNEMSPIDVFFEKEYNKMVEAVTGVSLSSDEE